MIGDAISGWIASQVQKAGAEGVVIGLSGGVDSSVTAVLAKRAQGEEVLGLIMPCYSHPQDLAHARLVAEAFDIRTQIVDQAPVFDAFLKALPDGDRIVAEVVQPSTHECLVQGRTGMGYPAGDHGQ